MDLAAFKARAAEPEHRLDFQPSVEQVYPAFGLRGEGSPSRYRHYGSGRGVNYYDTDENLRHALRAYLPADVLAWADGPLRELGERCGTEIVRRADVYDAAGHELVRYDKFGRDTSQVRYHPDWLTNLNEVFDFGLVGWNYDPQRLSRFGRAPYPLLAAFDYLVGQADMALCCPAELSHGAAVVLERFADAATRDALLPPVVATSEPSRLQVAQVATEITGGSDVGASRTEARQENGRWLLTGEKWFASNVGADLIVTLGRVDPDRAGTKGLGMFVVPRVRADGSPNGISVRRLKDKMGTIGVPTGELILVDAEAFLIGAPDKGFSYMAEMLNHTRFWNATGSVGIMRRSLLEAASYAARRGSFGTTVDRFPMVAERLVWLDVDLRATLSLLLHTASALEEAESTSDERAQLRFRTLAPVVKYRSGEQNVDFARAAIETMGANGYVATFGTPRLLRDAQVNTIWEGTSNICALDLWRAIVRQRGHEPVLDHCEQLVAALHTEPARTVGEAALQAGKDAREAITALAEQPQARQEQQARRLADLFGDAVATAGMAHEADVALRADGDHRPALAATLFTRRRTAPRSTPTSAVLGFTGVPETYPLLFGEQPLDTAGYRAAVAALDL